MHFPIDKERGYDREYFRGLISEQQVIHRRGGQNVMVWEKTYERNEPLDMRNYARAAFKGFRWNFDKYESLMRGETDKAPITKAESEKRKRKMVISGGIQV